MATFTCTACDFSKPVADEMAGKKARCPKCNAVMTIPPLDADESATSESDSEIEAGQEATEESTAEQAEAPQKSDPVNAPSSSSKSRKPEEAVPEFSPVPQSWLMGLGGAILLVAVAIILFVLQQINLGIICFAAGIVAFAAMSVMFCFGSGSKS